MERETGSNTVWWVLRVAAAMCFVGHGAFGIIGKDEWLPFFALVGIGPELGRTLMPVVGIVDVAAGFSVLVGPPRRAVLLYMVVWGAWTAMLRPLVGMPVWETVERAGNFGVPLAMLLWAGLPRARQDWLAPLDFPPLTRTRDVRTALTWTAGLLLIGHGALAVGEKPLLLEHFAAISLGTEWVVPAGWFEIALGVAVIVRPLRALLLGAATWKISTELLFPITGAPAWEWIERGGSYGAPIALALLGARLTFIRRSALPARRTATAASLALVAIAFIPGITEAQDSALVAQLRQGGYVLACRHAMTGPEGNSSASDPRDRQRNLSDEGVEQAKRMGAAIAELRIPIGAVLSSRYHRTRETAEHAFGRVEPGDSLQSPKSEKAFPRMLGTPPAPGTNIVLMTHQGVINPVLSKAIGGRVEEGACVVVRPDGNGGYQVVKNVSAESWGQLASRRGS
jgi:phosphohistidine phosphatase SixA